MLKTGNKAENNVAIPKLVFHLIHLVFFIGYQFDEWWLNSICWDSIFGGAKHLHGMLLAKICSYHIFGNIKQNRAKHFFLSNPNLTAKQ
jgi:hypothetical protein